MRSKVVRIASAGAVSALLVGSVLVSRLYVSAQGTPAPPPPLPSAPSGDALLITDAGALPTTTPTTATVSFVTSPSVAANVFWGKKLLGKIASGKALVIVRPHDSGPLDVMVRAQGYLPVQVRAHTFSDNRIVVKLTELGKENELLGYRAPIDAGVEAGLPLEGGVVDASVFVDAGYYPPVVPPPAPLTAPPPPPVPLFR